MLPIEHIYRTRTKKVSKHLEEEYLWILLCWRLGFDFPKERQIYLESTKMVELKKKFCLS